MNIYDIAKQANTSVTTVSRVLNNKTNVSAKTRKRVQDVLEKYDYTPNAMARALVAKTMKTIGVLTIDVRDPHYASTAYTIEQEFRKLGYNVILCNTGNSKEEKSDYIRVLSEKNVDGIILIGSIFNDKDIESSVSSYFAKNPVVLANGWLENENTYSVLVDDSYGISLCVEHLYNNGHRNILYVKDSSTYSADQKVYGYLTSMSKYNLPVDEDSIAHVERGLIGGYSAIESFINSKKEFTAVIFGEDITAIGGIKKLNEMNLKVPDNVAITGFNNSIFAECSNPELTSVDNKVEVVGTLSVRMLHDLMENKNLSRSILIRPDLKVRKSTTKKCL
ncbi:MAG: degA [Clostridiales bacterium]|nr:degA [Clostridiales bacterium]